MFIQENRDDEVVKPDIKKLEKLQETLYEKFKVDNAVVEEIIFRRESKNLPVSSKISKKELIELETYRFLNKYGYENIQNRTEEKKYYDTTANEIARIIDYINTSGIIK